MCLPGEADVLCAEIVGDTHLPGLYVVPSVCATWGVFPSAYTEGIHPVGRSCIFTSLRTLLSPPTTLFQVLPQVLPQMQPELPKECRESPRHEALPGGFGLRVPLQACSPTSGAGWKLGPRCPGKGSLGQRFALLGCSKSCACWGWGAPSQLMLAAKGGFIRAPLKEMLIVTFLHD